MFWRDGGERLMRFWWGYQFAVNTAVGVHLWRTSGASFLAICFVVLGAFAALALWAWSPPAPGTSEDE